MPGQRGVLKRNSRNVNMDDIGGIIFYVIAAIIGIITTVRNKKKKADKPSVVSETINKEVFTDSFEEEETMVYQPIPEGEFENDFWSELTAKEPIIEAPKSEAKDYSFDNTMEGMFEEPMAEQFKAEGRTGVLDVSDKDDSIEEEIAKDDLTKLDQTLKDFDLRKAIIYSEVINRKYY